jgi:hypothetical protein
MNKKALLMLSVIPLLLTACSPKYKSQFKEELSDNISSLYPFKVNSVSLKVVNKGKKGEEFTYHADLCTTEDLYTDVTSDNSDLEKFVAYCAVVDNASLTPQQRTELKQKLDGINASALVKFKANGGGNLLDGIDPRSNIPVKKVATPSGTKVSMDGKATALQDDFGKWSFSYKKQQFSSFDGARVGNDRWVLAGSAQDKALKQLTHDILSQGLAAEEAAVKIAEAEQQKHRAIIDAEQKQHAEEAKQRLMAGIEACAAGKVYKGFWQNSNSKGELGIRFDRQTDTGDGYSLEGIIFDPADIEHVKPFTGTFKGDGSGQNPFILQLVATKGEGFFHVDLPNGGYCSLNDPFAKPFLNKTSGFLVDLSSYSIQLRFNQAKQVFVGKIESTKFSPFVDLCGQPIEVFFSSDYKSKSAAPVTTPLIINPSAGADIDLAAPPTASTTTGKRTPDQVHSENAVVLKEFAEGFRAARAQKDVPKMKEIMQQVLAKYPDTATTHYWLLNIAFLEHNTEEVKKQHDILIGDFPETPELSAKREQQYNELIKAMSSGQ